MKKMFHYLASFWRRSEAALRIWTDHRGIRGKIWAIRLIIYYADAYLHRNYRFGLPLLNKLGQSGQIPAYEEPVGIRQLEILERQLQPLQIKVTADEPKKVNFILPTIDPKIMFGGYISAFNLIKKLIESAYCVRIIVTEPMAASLDEILMQLKPGTAPFECLKHAEVLFLHDRSTTVSVNDQDVFIGFSWVTARLAHQAAQQTNGRPFIYFIQEYEAVFHPLGSIHALCSSTYDLPHYAIFNSHLLPNYFRHRGLGVFKNNPQAGERRSIHFLHAIADVRPPSVVELEQREVRKLLFYARPEVYAARNLFELGVMALKEAVRRGIFIGPWEIHGIGSLNTQCTIELGGGCQLTLLKRTGYEQYVKLLRNYDVGMSLMYAPHPSVPPLEMAAAGLVTVTSLFENRTPRDMESISGNIIAVQPDISSICGALAEASIRAMDVETRISKANFNWPRSWAESFNEPFMQKLRNFIDSEQIQEVTQKDGTHLYYHGHL